MSVPVLNSNYFALEAVDNSFGEGIHSDFAENHSGGYLVRAIGSETFNLDEFWNSR